MYSFIYDVNDFYKLNDIMVLMQRHCIADVNGADMAEWQTQKAQTLRRNRVGSNPTIRIRTILTDLLDGLNSNEEKQVRKVVF